MVTHDGREIFADVVGEIVLDAGDLLVVSAYEMSALHARVEHEEPIIVDGRMIPLGKLATLHVVSDSGKRASYVVTSSKISDLIEVTSDQASIAETVVRATVRVADETAVDVLIASDQSDSSDENGDGDSGGSGESDQDARQDEDGQGEQATPPDQGDQDAGTTLSINESFTVTTVIDQSVRDALAGDQSTQSAPKIAKKRAKAPVRASRSPSKK
jgi:hypothetical protein